jgi:hypothetical protein
VFKAEKLKRVSLFARYECIPRSFWGIVISSPQIRGGKNLMFSVFNHVSASAR